MAGKRNFLPAMHEKGLEVYFRDINRYELLTREQEFELARGIRAGDEEALQTLVRANLRFVVSVAKRYVNQGLMLSDLINEGNLGLLKAAHRFDEERGYRFISYAVWWIRQSIMQALLDKSRTIRLPQNQTAVLIKINRARVQLQQQGMTDPRPGQLAEHLGIKRSEVLQALKADHTEVALDDVGADGSDRPLAEVIEDTTQASPDAAVLERGLREDVRRCPRPRRRCLRWNQPHRLHPRPRQDRWGNLPPRRRWPWRRPHRPPETALRLQGPEGRSAHPPGRPHRRWLRRCRPRCRLYRNRRRWLWPRRLCRQSLAPGHLARPYGHGRRRRLCWWLHRRCLPWR